MANCAGSASLEALTEAVHLQEGATAQQLLIRILETKQVEQYRNLFL